MPTIPSPYENYPPRWAVFDQHVSILGAGMFDFHGTTTDVNRFAARYRAARSFRRAEFEGLTNDTCDGYSMLCQLLLTYSAFEYLLRAIGLELRNTSTLLTDEERDRVLSYLRGLNGSRELYRVIRPFAHAPYQRQIDNHLAGRHCNPIYLAGAIRHAFAHGMLTATPSRVPSQTVATVSRYLNRVLMHIMDREFETRNRDFERAMDEDMQNGN